MQNIQHVFEKKHIRIIITDSGLGGLSVHALIDKKLRIINDKQIELIYFNSFAGGNFGYNSLKNVNDKLLIFDSALKGMMKLNPDIILIACNTLSVLFNQTKMFKEIEIPVIGIVDNGIEMILDKINTVSDYNIVIVGTETTINSNQHKTKLVNSGIDENKIVSQACENLESEIQINPNSNIVEKLIREYLFKAVQKIRNPKLQTLLLLGCTHYGYSKEIFEKVLTEFCGNNFEVLNPNEKMAEIFNELKSDIGITENIIKNRILSRVKIREEQIENLRNLLKLDSIYLVKTLENAEFIPNLFTFDENSINQN
ncbi:MAG: aspartate/glutamate racemase family protein [Ignavibacteriae bacterium]|nr:aspartate/glutamate racemase family protein [Ignavibacteriota bacterium]